MVKSSFFPFITVFIKLLLFFFTYAYCFFPFSTDDLALYESLKDYILTDEKMIENNYPVQHPEKPGSAVSFTDKKVNTDRK